MHSSWRGWLGAMAVAATVGIAALLTNITTWEQLSGRANGMLAARFTLSALLNSGTVWAALPVLAGWLVRSRWQSVLAGILAAEVALTVHYGCGVLLDVFTDTPVNSSVYAGNEYWFVIAAVACGPLGLVGALARRSDVLGLFSRLVVPAGAMLEPFVKNSFRPNPILPWPTRFSETACGVMLLVSGLVMAVVVISRWRKDV